jgi:hypothetical protein
MQDEQQSGRPRRAAAERRTTPDAEPGTNKAGRAPATSFGECGHVYIG